MYGEPPNAIAISDKRLTNNEAEKIARLIARLPELVELEKDRNKAMSRRKPQPLQAFATKLTLSGEPAMPRIYIYAKKAGIGDNFRKFYERAKSEGWKTYEIDASHNPHITNPAALLAILNEIAGQ